MGGRQTNSRDWLPSLTVPRTLRQVTWLLLALVAISQWCLRAYTVILIKIPLDYDGAYYLYEFTQYLQFHHGYYHSYSFFFWITSLCARAAGLDEYQLYQFLVICSLAWFAVALTVSLSRTRYVYLSPVMALASLQSEPIYFLFYGYPKQAWGYVCMVWVIALWQTLPQGRQRDFAVVFLTILGGLFHLWTGVLGAGLLLFYRPIRPVRRFFVAMVVIVSSMALTDRSNVYQLLSNVSITPNFSWSKSLALGQLSALELSQYVLYGALTVALVVIATRSRLWDAPMWYIGTLAITFGIPSWHSHDGQIYRFLISAPPLSLMFVCQFLAAFSGLRWSFLGDIFLIMLSCASVASSAILPSGPRPIGPALPLSAIVSNQDTLQRWIPPSAFVRAPHGVQFWVRYFLDRRSAQNFPEPRWEGDLFEIRVKGSRYANCPSVSAVDLSEQPTISCVTISNNWVIRKLPENDSRPH